MVLNPHFVITTCLLFLVSITSWSKIQTDSIYFEKYYSKINQNIENGKYQKNINLIDELLQKQKFQNLDCYRKGKIYHKIGVSYYLLNQEVNAIIYYRDKTLNIWENCPWVPLSEKAKTIYNIGISYQYLNDLEAAKEHIDQALHIFEKDSLYPKFDLARKYYGIARFYQDLNDSFRATLYYRNAINLYREENSDKKWEFEVLNDLIVMNNGFKDYAKSKEYIKEALSIQKDFSHEIPQLNLAWVYLNAGVTYFELEEYESSRSMAQKALNKLDVDTEPFFYSIALETMAMIHLEEKKFELAEKSMNRVLEIREKLYSNSERQRQLVLAYENLCDILIRKGDINGTNQKLNRAFEILVPNATFDKDHLPIIKNSKALDDSNLIRLIELKARIFEAKYKESQDIKFLKKALKTQHKIDSVINRSLVSFQFEQSKLDFLNLKFEHYGKAVEDALTLHKITGDPFYLKEAYYFSSKTKAIVLQYELNQADAFQSNVPKEVIQKEKALREEMHTQQTLLAEATTNKDSLLQTYTKAQYELDSYLKEIEIKEPVYFKEKYAFVRPPELKKIQKGLPSDMAVIEYFISEKMIYSFWLTQDQFFPIAIPYDQEIKIALDNFITQCHNPKATFSKVLAKLLFKKCLKQGLGNISKDIKRLCIIPDGELHKLSFEALINEDTPDEKYLIEEYAISYSYAVSLLFREHANVASQNYIGFGAKYSNDLNKKLKARKQFFGNESLSQLVLSHEEIKRGAAIFDGQTFIDDKATLQNFLQHSPKADIIHLSLHGLVDIDDPGRSCIIFDDHQDNFILSAQDLFGNRLRADLVLLSACHSASGKIYSGEGVQGMSKSFLLGGAHNILSSLWNASEASSMAITTSFLEYIHEGKPTDLALHQSKLDYLSKVEPSKRHPYYWANFILLGEVSSPKTPINSILWIAGIILLILIIYIISSKTSSKKAKLISSSVG